MKSPLSTESAGEGSLDREALNACWKEIGIWGNKQCPELATCTHCRNCPVFSSAASSLLDRPLPPGYREEWTGHFVDKKAAMVLRTLSVLVFRLGEEILAIPMRVLQEVTEWRIIRKVPHRRQGVVLGLVNVRGELIICVSIGATLGIVAAPQPSTEPAAERRSSRLIIVKRDSDRFAFPVDEIFGIARISAGELKDLPATVVHGNRRCVGGMISWKGKSAGLLDEERLFDTLNRSLG